MNQPTCALCSAPASVVWAPRAKPSWRTPPSYPVCSECAEMISSGLQLADSGPSRLCTGRVQLASADYGLCTRNAIVATGRGVSALCPDHLLRVLRAEHRSFARVGRDRDEPAPAFEPFAPRLSA